MKRSGIINLLAIGGIVIVLVLLQVVFYANPMDTNESEEQADRSTYSSRTFGLKALYLLLEDTGYKVNRYREPYTSLKTSKIKSFAIISPPPTFNPTEEEFKALADWVEDGGRLLVVDHRLDFKIGSDIEISTPTGGNPQALQIEQPSPLTAKVERPRFSDFVRRITVKGGESITLIGDKAGAALAEISYGSGRIILLSDVYPLANNGLGEGDNLTLTMNLIHATAPDGQLYIDEYHHGYGANFRNGFFGYFQGTPITWIILQLFLLTLIVIYSRGRRFSRPVPLKTANRASTLEYVGSMAHLQHLAHAKDLAIENIYTRFRQRLCRYAGQPTNVSARPLAEAAARRSKINPIELHQILVKCEETLHGAALKDEDLLAIIGRLRKMQAELGI